MILMNAIAVMSIVHINFKMRLTMVPARVSNIVPSIRSPCSYHRNIVVASFVAMFFLQDKSAFSENVHIGLIGPLDLLWGNYMEYNFTMDLVLTRMNTDQALTALRERDYNFVINFGESRCETGLGLIAMIKLKTKANITLSSFIGKYVKRSLEMSFFHRNII